jgi:hypothetical protein
MKCYTFPIKYLIFLKTIQSALWHLPTEYQKLPYDHLTSFEAMKPIMTWSIGSSVSKLKPILFSLTISIYKLHGVLLIYTL